MGLLTFLRRSPAPQAVPRVRSAPTPAPPPPVRLPEAGEAARFGLYSSGAVTHGHPGDTIVRQGEASRSLCAIVDGSATVYTGDDGERQALGTLRPGECVGTLDGTAGPSPYSVIADGPCTWITMSAAAVNLLSPTDQFALYRWAASESFKWLDRIIVRQAELRRETQAVAAAFRAERQRAIACVSSNTVQDVIAGVPRLPVYASDLLGKLLDERTYADQLVEAIKDDPALAALVLRTVNSAAYGLATNISDYYHAFLYLGAIKVYQLIVASGVESVMPDVPGSRDVYTHSKAISLIAYEIARVTDRIRPELATTIGLLHDVGRVVALLIGQRHPETAALAELLDPASLGAALLRSWDLPDRVIGPIAAQRCPEVARPEDIDPDHLASVAVLYLAHVCADAIAGVDVPAASTVHADAYAAALGLEPRNPLELCQTRIVPALKKHANQLPPSIRESLHLSA